MSVPQSEKLGQEPFEPAASQPGNDAGLPATEAEKARLTAKFSRLATDIVELSAMINILEAQLGPLVERERGLPTRAESDLKPRRERRADAQLRNRAHKARWDVEYARQLAVDEREALEARAAELGRVLAGMGVGAEELMAAEWAGARE